MDGRNWIVGEIEGNISYGEMPHDDILGAIADVFDRAFALIGSCRFPLYIAPTMAREWFEIW